MFWLRKFRCLSKESKKDWIKIIQSVKNSKNEKVIISYLQSNLKKEAAMDLPCYTNSAVQDDFIRNRIWENCKKWDSSDEDFEIVKILAPLTVNPNAPPVSDGFGRTPIYWAAYNGHTEIVKFLAPLTDNPNVPNRCGDTPIHRAAYMGHTEIVKILIPLTDNPNAPNDDGWTPSSVAENPEICRILKSFNICYIS